jgi:hypothetical protein
MSKYEFVHVDRIVNGEVSAEGLPGIFDSEANLVAPFPEGRDDDVRRFMAGMDHAYFPVLFHFATPGVPTAPTVGNREVIYTNVREPLRG